MFSIADINMTQNILVKIGFKVQWKNLKPKNRQKGKHWRTC